MICAQSSCDASLISHNSKSRGSKVGCVEVEVGMGVSVVSIASTSVEQTSLTANQNEKTLQCIETIRISNLMIQTVWLISAITPLKVNFPIQYSNILLDVSDLLR
jgi:hypothetical protein